MDRVDREARWMALFMILCSQSKLMERENKPTRRALGFRFGRELSTSAKCLVWVWPPFAFFLVASFECNLRAYLVSSDFEPTVDNDE